MAVINSPYVGNARGKLGEAVFLRSKGNTVARAYNPSPQNRRTASQQSQRSVFSSAVKFYSRGIQNLFVFAFENKKTQESDYNAFMRYNANRGIYFGPQQNDDDSYPALGNFVLSRGSLGSFQQRLDTNNGPTFTAQSRYSTLPSISTWGGVSQVLVDLGFMEGDILTFLGIETGAYPGSPTAPVIEATIVPEWQIRQVKVDTSATYSPASVGMQARFVGPAVFELNAVLDQSFEEQIAAGSFIVSREVSGTLRVSNSDLMLNQEAQQAYEYGRSDSWRRLVLQAWGYEQQTILQGSLSANEFTPGSDVVVSYSFDLPQAFSALAGEVIRIFPLQEPEVIAANIMFTTDGGQVLSTRVVGGAIEIFEDADLLATLTPVSGQRFSWQIGDDAGGPTIASIKWRGQ